jgi:hypothetical protein
MIGCGMMMNDTNRTEPLTSCGRELMPIKNPSVVDPPSSAQIRFGLEPQECPVPKRSSSVSVWIISSVAFVVTVSIAVVVGVLYKKGFLSKASKRHSRIYTHRYVGLLEVEDGDDDNQL